MNLQNRGAFNYGRENETKAINTFCSFSSLNNNNNSKGAEKNYKQNTCDLCSLLRSVLYVGFN